MRDEKQNFNNITWTAASGRMPTFDHLIAVKSFERAFPEFTSAAPRRTDPPPRRSAIFHHLAACVQLSNMSRSGLSRKAVNLLLPFFPSVERTRSPVGAIKSFMRIRRCKFKFMPRKLTLRKRGKSRSQYFREPLNMASKKLVVCLL